MKNETYEIEGFYKGGNNAPGCWRLWVDNLTKDLAEQLINRAKEEMEKSPKNCLFKEVRLIKVTREII